MCITNMLIYYISHYYILTTIVSYDEYTIGDDCAYVL